MSVNFSSLYDLIQKGFKVVQTLEESGADISVAYTALKNLALKKKEDVTQADMDETHKVLMDQLTQFNVELPD